MFAVTLPDGSVREYDAPLSISEVAFSIGPGLGKAAIAGVVDNVLVDMDYPVARDVDLKILTTKDDASLEIIRHSTAHLMAQAVKKLFPEVQVTIGPVIEDGFYYDFAFERSFTPDDLESIEEEMKNLVSRDIPVSRFTMSRNDAMAFFQEQGEAYKVEIIESIPEGEELSLYKQGDFVDLCRGPHVPSTGYLKAFKLTKVAGSYWRGDSNKEMLQRIYGTAWGDQKTLKAYLHRLEEAEKRDHRRLGKQFDLFHFQEEAPGMVFWHEKGWSLYREVENYVRGKLVFHGYQEIKTPQVVDRSLWERSGHWENFGDLIFTTRSDDREYAIKPMNCPCHVQVFNQGLKSYRDLPLRLAEFGSCHRNEPSGTRHGLMRVTNFVQDDAHIFCTEDQIQSEVSKLIDLVFEFYGDFGFEDVRIELSTRPEKRVGSETLWDKAENALRTALNRRGLEWKLNPGDGAFYGPKIDCHLGDSLGREWQCGTIQVDFSMPGRLGAEYVTETGEREIPVMLHRAILGSLERFIGVLIEEYAGRFPVWLAPIQVAVLAISQNQTEYAQNVENLLRKWGFRARSDLRNEKIGLKIREHTLERVPYLLIVGAKEVEGLTVAVRTRGGTDKGAMSLEDFAAELSEAIACRGKNCLED